MANLPMKPRLPAWQRSQGLALATVLCIVGVAGIAVIVLHPIPPDRINIGTITTNFSPDGQSKAAPNGTATVDGTCTNSTSWTDDDSPNLTVGPPFKTAMNVSCVFVFLDSSLNHLGPNGSNYLVTVTFAEVSSPFVFVQSIPYETGCSPRGCPWQAVGQEFQMPSQPGTYNLVFTLLYTWVYLVPPS